MSREMRLLVVTCGSETVGTLTTFVVWIRCALFVSKAARSGEMDLIKRTRLMAESLNEASSCSVTMIPTGQSRPLSAQNAFMSNVISECITFTQKERADKLPNWFFAITGRRRMLADPISQLTLIKFIALELKAHLRHI